MANEINLKIKVGDDGTLNIVAKEAKKAAKATDELGRSTDRVSKSRSRYHKGEKGVAQAGLSSAKSFSKMNQTMTGSSGLVGAYAVLAANIFALTAAFGALQRAAQVEQLEAGLRSMGTASGIAMKQLSEGLREATGNALNLEDAMRATALASSAGFDSSSIERLGKVARQASIALGRDTADSLNRLTKGAIKLEPELLDELGIMVRLDEATEAYARSVNKSAGDLTNFEKRQAFMNAVLEEGERKFAAMADVPTNAFDQLSATFQDLTKNLLNFLNTGLLPIVNFFAGSQAALFGALVLFGKGIATSMIPALGDLGGSYEKVRKRAAAAAAGQVAQLKNWTGSSKALQKVVKNFDPLNTSQKELNNIQTKANRILKTHTTQLANWETQAGKTTDQINAKKVATNEAQQAVNNAGRSSFFFAAAQREEGDMAAVNAAAQGNYKEAISKLGEQFDSANASTAAATKGTDRWTKTALTARNVAGKTALAVRVLGTAFLNMIPIIGQIIFFLGIFWSVGQKILTWMKDPKQKEYEDMIHRHREANEELVESLRAVEKFNKGQISTVGSVTQKYTALTNAFSAFNTQLKQLNETQVTGSEEGMWLFGGRREDKGAYKDMLKMIFQTNQMSKDSFDQLTQSMGHTTKSTFEVAYFQDKWGQLLDRDAKKMLNEFIPQVLNSATAVNNMTNSVKESNQAIDEWANSISFKTTVDNVLASFDNMRKSMIKFGGSSAEEWVKGFEEQAGSNLENLIDLSSLRAQALEGGTSGDPLEGVVFNAEKYRDLIKDAIGQLTEQFEKQQKIERLNKAQTTALKSEITLLKHKNLVVGNAAEIIKKEDEIRKKQKELLESRINNYMALNKLTEKDKDSNEMLIALGTELLTLEEQMSVEADHLLAAEKEKLGIFEHENRALKESLTIMGQMSAMQNKILDAKQSSIEADIEAQNRADPMRGYKGALNAADKLKALDTDVGKVLMIDEKGVMTQSKETKTLLEAREIAIENELHMTKLKNEMERKILHMRMKVIDLELQAAHERSGGKGDYAGRNTMQGMMDQLGDEGVFATMQNNLAEAVAQAARDGLTNASGKLKEQQANEILGATGGTTADVIGAQNEAGGLDSLEHTSQKFQAMQNAMAPLMESMRKLGPEGELVASVAQGALVVGQSWAKAGEVLSSKAETFEKVGAVASAVAQTFQQIGQIMAASSNARIAGIDKEIEAEKKRDGKSKESLAKIKQLEKKKEQEKRKAFEMQKKMQIASAIASTAAAVAGALGAPPPGPWNIALAAMIGAMGMAQVALISSQSYQGGSGSADVSGPASIAVGERKKTADLAKSRSARGELAYFRGDQGIGGPENFRGAFYGKKHRAYGGTTGYVVGEQGPELFMPDRPGTIIPADDTAAMAGGGSNVTFNINAVDAAGVEEVLTEQQGHIISMLRTAANAQGEEFMETIDDQVLTPHQGYVSRR